MHKKCETAERFSEVKTNPLIWMKSEAEVFDLSLNRELLVIRLISQIKLDRSSTFSLFVSGSEPKLTGCWNLVLVFYHEAVQLFMVLFSCSGVWMPPGSLPVIFIFIVSINQRHWVWVQQGSCEDLCPTDLKTNQLLCSFMESSDDAHKNNFRIWKSDAQGWDFRTKMWLCVFGVKDQEDI